MIAVGDIGEFGAAALLRPDECIGQAPDLAGDELTMPEVASHLSRIQGRPMTFQHLSDDRALANPGADFAAIFTWLNEVGSGADSPDLTTHWGIPLTTLTEHLAHIDRATGYGTIHKAKLKINIQSGLYAIG